MIITGAGISGVASAVLVSKKVRNSTVTVYDKADKIVSQHLVTQNHGIHANSRSRVVPGLGTNSLVFAVMFHPMHIVTTSSFNQSARDGR